MERDIDPGIISEQELMQEFMKLTAADIQENELTVKQFEEFMNVPHKRAAYVLAKYEGKKLLKARKVIVNSSLVNAYSPRDGTWKDVVDKIRQE